jgi:hypothetical protein
LAQRQRRFPALTEEEVKLKANEIIASVRLGVLRTIGTLVKHPAFTFYVGETKQDRKELEDLRWITERGANLPDGQGYKGGRNRPVLVWSNLGTDKPSAPWFKTGLSDQTLLHGLISFKR